MTKVDSIERLINSAWQALSLGNASLAMQLAQQANEKDPSSAEVAHILGVLASRDGRPDIALPLLQKSIDAGVTAQKLRHITEALLVAGHAKAALSPITDALKNYPAEAETFGLLAAVQVALEQWSYALKSAKQAVNLSPHNPAWQGTLSFCLLMQQQWVEGFEAWSGRAEKFSSESRSPAFHLAKPCELWIKNEQGPGDTLFFARYAPYLHQLGYKLHLQTDKKTLPLLAQTQVFASVQDKFKAKPTDFWLSIGDLPLAAIQTACIPVQNALKIHADEKLKAKYRQELEKIGPAPYIAITWRGGPKGKKQRAGVRMFEKLVDPNALGELIKPIQATFISVQRVPDTAEYLALCKASGKKIADFSALNNNLPGMLALLDIIDDYIAVPNTNVHLRESLEKSTHVLLNRPYQDWRWLADGDKSPWYPNATIYRPSIEGEWQAAFNQLQTNLIKHHTQHDNSGKPILAQNNYAHESLQQSEQAILDNLFKEKIAEGWEAIDNNNVATAIKMAQEVMTHSPQHPRAMHLLGWAALTDLKFEMAASILQNAAQLAPNDGIIWRDFLRSLIAIKKFDDVFNIAEQLLQNPDLRSKSSIYYARAALYLQLGNNEKALADYDTCLAISPNYIDALGFSGMIRMKTGDVRRGFREYTARKEARYDGHVCPWLRGNVKGVKVLIRRHMGLGDELSYLRYLPWLEYAGVEVDYWAGAKLAPILARMGYCKQVISDKESLPESENYDLCFEVNELPLAVEALGAPEIAPPLPIKPREDLIAKWKNWLEAQGPGPYIGFNWRAGAASQDTSIVFSKLAKAIDATPFANALGVVNATFISLQRNVTKLELDQFSRDLGAPIHDAAGLTDDLDDLLALLSLLDENIGVSNTNMHLRAGLGLGSKVLVQNPAGDWRWGSEGTHSIWFTQSKVYRQTLQDGSWNEALSILSQDLSQLYSKKDSDTVISPIQSNALKQQPTHTQKIIWVTAGEITETPMGKTSNIGSTLNRVLAPAKGLESLGWQSEFVNEGLSEVMGGWGNVLPQHGDTVIISKVFTNHGARLAKDAKDRGAKVIVDFCDNFLNNPKRAPLQRQLASLADKIVCSENTISQAFNDYAHISTQVIPDMQLDQIDSSLIHQWHTVLSADVIKKTALPDSHDVYPITQRILWLSAGEVTQHNGIISSNLASTRYRVLLPAANLGSYGWKSEIIKEAELLTFGWKNHQPTKGDTLVVSKIFDIRSLGLIKEAKNNGAIIVADYCDNHFERLDQMGLLQQGILDNADCIITSTPELADYIQSQSRTPCTHVTDCFEGIKGKPNFKPKTPLKLMWFGGVANHDTLPDFLKKLAKFAEKTPIEIDLVTLHNNGDEAAKNATTTALKVNYIPWSLAQFNAKLQACDMVVIPTIEADYKSGKSPNRVIEPLWAGKYVVAGHLPAYEPFAPFASIGNDLIAGIEWAINNPAQVIEKIKAGQAYIAANHTPKLIGEKWHQVLSNIKKDVLPSSQIKDSRITRIGILGTQKDYIPSMAICLREPFNILNNKYAISYCSYTDEKGILQTDTKLTNEADVLIVVRDYVSEHTQAFLSNLLKTKKVIYFTDDAFHLIPKDHPKALHLDKKPYIEWMMHQADAIVVSTEPLKDSIKTTKPIFIAPNYLSKNIWLKQDNQINAKTNSTIRIGLLGGDNHIEDFKKISSVIEELTNQYPEIVWVSLGKGANAALGNIKLKHVDVIPANFVYDGYPKRLFNANLDLVAVPLLNDSFNQCISNLKCLETGILGIPGVFEKITPYKNTITHGVNGYLADTLASWKHSLESLIQDEKLRIKMGLAARENILQNWMLDHEKSPWDSIIQQVLGFSDKNIAKQNTYTAKRWQDYLEESRRHANNPATNLSKPPLVSIIIASYNHAHYIEETLESIKALNYPNVEVVIVDDVSTDNSVDVISAWINNGKFQLTLEKNPQNLGTGKTLQHAFELASGDYILPFASDDILLPTALDGIIDALESKPEHAMFISSGLRFNAQGDTAPINDKQLFEQLKKGPVDCLHYFYTNVSNLFIQGCVIKKSFFTDCGGFPTHAPSEDWALVIKMFEQFANGNGTYLLAENHLAFGYRRHENNVSRNLRKQLFRKLMTVRALSPKSCWPQAIINIYEKEIRMSADENYKKKCKNKISVWKTKSRKVYA